MKFAYSEQVLRASSDETAMAFFFNARGGPMERSPKGMYRSLLHQLLGSDSLPQLRPIFHDSALKPHVRLQLAQTYEQIFSNNPSPTWGIDCLKDLLRVAIDRLAVEQELTIFVDALDECVSEEVQEMVEHFDELGTAAISSQKQLRICFSSRHYPQIEIAHRRELVLELQHGHEQDISAYIENKLRIGLSEGATRIKREVQRKASGVFMWVILAPLRVLPPKLSELFREIVHQGNEDNGEDGARCLRLRVQGIGFSRRQLTLPGYYYTAICGLSPRELSEWDPKLVTVEDMKRFLLSSSKRLAESNKTTGDGNKFRVQFIHESVREYFLKDGLAELFPGLTTTALRQKSHLELQSCCHSYVEHITKLFGNTTKTPEKDQWA
ncbi:hypothetical protein QC764_311140 [Podospora pseudoanserina]|uniref:Nephrocystin 3-like N-terminal domain-containing protein n=1 Tax=Podospora pseudoanserina TaxID=2609844 RepID=A0ABR0IEI2_9PEZI|nr:hypothetical protein QC764_311140 [Podospora pseudoanserina]